MGLDNNNYEVIGEYFQQYIKLEHEDEVRWEKLLNVIYSCYDI